MKAWHASAGSLEDGRSSLVAEGMWRCGGLEGPRVPPYGANAEWSFEDLQRPLR